MCKKAERKKKNRRKQNRLVAQKRCEKKEKRQKNDLSRLCEWRDVCYKMKSRM